MSERLYSQANLRQTLRRYIHALERGDQNAIIAILRNAELDPLLEQRILEIGRFYQMQGSVAVHGDDLAEVHRFVADLQQTNSRIPHERRVQTMSEHIRPVSTDSIRNRKATSRRVLSGSTAHFLEAAAAVLVVGVLVIGFVLAFASRHPSPVGNTTGNSSSQRIITAISNGTIYALQPDSGSTLWTFATHESHGVEVLAQDSRAVYAYVQEQGQVYALQASNGHLLWKTHLDITPGRTDEGTGNIVLDRGILFINATDLNQGDFIYAVRVSDGALLWHYHATFSSGLAAANGIVYTGSTDTTGSNPVVVALRETDGKLLWSYSANPVSIAVANNIVYVHSAHIQTVNDHGGNKEDMPLLALNAQKGTVLWSQPTIDDAPGPLAIENDLVILATAYHLNTYHFCAYQSTTGNQLWCTQNTPTPISGNPAQFSVMAGILYVTHANSSSIQFDAFSADTGQLLWTKNLITGNTNFLATMNGILYTGSGSNLAALSGADGHTLWQTHISNIVAIATSP